MIRQEAVLRKRAEGCTAQVTSSINQHDLSGPNLKPAIKGNKGQTVQIHKAKAHSAHSVFYLICFIPFLPFESANCYLYVISSVPIMDTQIKYGQSLSLN